jgi:hypothetical protein
MFPSTKNTTPFWYPPKPNSEGILSHPFGSYPKPQIFDLVVLAAYPFGSVLSSVSKGVYRYGWQNQERVDEISGNGNHYTAMFWEYDTRIGRRWNVDPVDKPWESSYACFWNNPIRVIDPNGDDGYVDEDGNYLGDDGDKKSHETRVINKGVWESTIGKNDKGELNEITADIRKTLQTNIGTDKEGNTIGTSKLLDQYEKGIRISDKTWKTLTDNGGKKLSPYVTNNSNSTVYYKPEGQVDGKNVNPYQSGTGSIKANTDLYSPVDGVATKKYSDAVYKVVTGVKLTVKSDGEVISERSWKPDGWFKGGSYYWDRFLDDSWLDLLKHAEKNGGVKY